MAINELPIRVLIVDDVDSLRESLFQLLNVTPGFVCVGAIPNALDILSQVAAVRPDVILMDINMPGKSGIEAVREIRQQGDLVTIVMQTIFEEDDKVFESILAGANGYILKSTKEEHLLNAIKEAQLGGAPMSPAIATKVLRFLREQKMPAATEKTQIPGEEDLNERQLEVLELLIDGASYKMIAAELFISMDTVRYHIKNIYKTLHIHSRAQLIRGK